MANKTSNTLISTVEVMPKYSENGMECVGTSQQFEIIVNPATEITAFTANPSAFLCEDEELSIKITATGSNIVYQWYHDSSIIAGEKSSEYHVNTLSNDYSGVYYVEAIGFCGSAKSKPITIKISSANMLVEKWNDVILVNNITEEYIGYQWYKDGRIINGAKEQFYQEIGGLNGCYSVELRLKVGGRMRSCVRCAYKTSKSGEIYVYPNPAGSQLIVDYGRDGACPVPTGEYQIFSVVGQVVMEGVLPCRDAINCVSTISVESLVNGMYFLKIGGKTVRFVKE